MIFDGDFTEPWGPDETRESRFCFIGKNLDRNQAQSSDDALFTAGCSCQDACATRILRACMLRRFAATCGYHPLSAALQKPRLSKNSPPKFTLHPQAAAPLAPTTNPDLDLIWFLPRDGAPIPRRSRLTLWRAP